MEKVSLQIFIDEYRSTREIAEFTGRSQTTVRHWLKKYGLKTKIKPCNMGGEAYKPEEYRKLSCCAKCGESDPTKFYMIGRIRRKTRCRSCHNREQITRLREYKREAVAYKGGSCEKCGYQKCIAAFDFHHLDPKKKDPNWKLMRNWKFDKIKSELDKCILVCRNCHAEIHFGV